MLTHATLFDLLRRNLKNMENLNHNLNDCVHHLRGRRQFCIDFETPEKRLNTFKNVDKSISACLNILCCLRDESVTMAPHEVSKDTHLKEDPNPGKYDIRGREYLPDKYEIVDLRQFRVLRHTRLTPAAIVEERT